MSTNNMGDIDIESSPLRNNRYSKIHVLFRKIAEAKGYHKYDSSHWSKGGPVSMSCKFCNINTASIQVKDYWKNFMNVKSLTELSDTQLYQMELLIEARLGSLKKQ